MPLGIEWKKQQGDKEGRGLRCPGEQAAATRHLDVFSEDDSILVQLFWKTVWWFLEKLKRELPYTEVTSPG